MRSLATITMLLALGLELHHCTPLALQWPATPAPSSYHQQLAATAIAVGARPEHLHLVVGLESGHNPAARNPHTGATGLIQWMPATARALGTDTAAIRRMGRTEQLQLVAQYLQPYRPHLGTLDGLYLAIFFPAALRHDSLWVLRAPGLPAWRVAAQNSIFDTNNDGRVQRYEVAQYLRRRHHETTAR